MLNSSFHYYLNATHSSSATTSYAPLGVVKQVEPIGPTCLMSQNLVDWVIILNHPKKFNLTKLAR